MKAVIVEIRENSAAALGDDGCIIKVKNRNYVIGQVIEMKEKVMKKPAKMLALAATAAVAVIMVGCTAWAYYTPYTYVSLDVNPSIKYTVNRFNRVLGAQAVNGDGAEILNDLSLTNKAIDDAVKETVQQIDEAGYFNSQDPGGIVISTASDNQEEAEKLAEKLESAAEQTVEGNETPVEVEAISVGRERVLEAEKLGTTPGKLNLVEKLQAQMGTSENISVEEWLKRPVKEIMKAIKTAKQEEKSLDKQKDGKNTSGDVQSGAPNSSSQADSSLASSKEPAKAAGNSSKVNGKSGDKANNTSSTSVASSEAEKSANAAKGNSGNAKANAGKGNG